MNETYYAVLDTYMGDGDEANNNYSSATVLRAGYFEFKSVQREYRLFFLCDLFSNTHVISGDPIVPGSTISSATLILHREAGDSTTATHYLFRNTRYLGAVVSQLTWNIFFAIGPDNEWTGGEEYVDTDIVTAFSLLASNGTLHIDVMDHAIDAVTNRSGILCMSSMRNIPAGGPVPIPMSSQFNQFTSNEGGGGFTGPRLRVEWEPPQVVTVGRLAGRAHQLGGLYGGRLL